MDIWLESPRGKDGPHLPRRRETEEITWELTASLLLWGCVFFHPFLKKDMLREANDLKFWSCFGKCRHSSCLWAFPGGTSGKGSDCWCRRCKRLRFSPWGRKIPWKRKWQPMPIFLPGKFNGQEAWQAKAHRVAKSQTPLSAWTCTQTHTSYFHKDMKAAGVLFFFFFFFFYFLEWKKKQ